MNDKHITKLHEAITLMSFLKPGNALEEEALIRIRENLEWVTGDMIREDNEQGEAALEVIR